MSFLLSKGGTGNTRHAKLKAWVAEMAALCKPDRVAWIDGSEEEKKRLEDEAVATGEIIRLNTEKLPGCFYHRTAVNDVARTEHLTYICTKKKKMPALPITGCHPKMVIRRRVFIFAAR